MRVAVLARTFHRTTLRGVEPYVGKCVSYTLSPPAVCMLHTMKSADLCKLLEKAGWVLTRTRGSHRQYTKDGRTVTVPHPKKALGVGLVKAIRKHAGL